MEISVCCLFIRWRRFNIYYVVVFGYCNDCLSPRDLDHEAVFYIHAHKKLFILTVVFTRVSFPLYALLWLFGVTEKYITIENIITFGYMWTFTIFFPVLSSNYTKRAVFQQQLSLVDCNCYVFHKIFIYNTKYK